MKLNDQLKAAGVTRWHIVETTRTQNLAEHQFNVALIARRLGALCGLISTEQTACMALALTHDQHEIVDGDTPSTAKGERGLEGGQMGRIVQMADKIEAYWFIKHRHVNRPDVVEDVRARLSRLLDDADDDFATAVAQVMTELELL